MVVYHDHKADFDIWSGFLGIEGNAVFGKSSTIETAKKEVAGNKLADEIAHFAPAFRMMGPEPCIVVGLHTMKELLRIEERVGRKQHW